MRKNRIKGVVAASVAALGLTALAVTSANASGGETGPGPEEQPANIEIQQTENGGTPPELTQEELDAVEGSKPSR